MEQSWKWNSLAMKTSSPDSQNLTNSSPPVIFSKFWNDFLFSSIVLENTKSRHIPTCAHSCVLLVWSKILIAFFIDRIIHAHIARDVFTVVDFDSLTRSSLSIDSSLFFRYLIETFSHHRNSFECQMFVCDKAR